MSDAPHRIDDDQHADSALDKEKTQAVKEFSHPGEGELSMHVKVYSPFHDYYDGEAFSVSAENTTGPFDILPRHHNFITLLSPCDVVVRTASKGEQRIRIAGGIMHVKADKAVIFLDV